MATGTIHYGFGAEYLPTWGINEALREIYQNFLDYGDYEEERTESEGFVSVTLTNGWEPANLEYLRIGNTRKDNPNSIGHHGEGLKMAFLILLREGLASSIMTSKYSVIPEWYKDSEIGDCFSFAYETHENYQSPYTLSFTCPTEAYRSFHDNLIKPTDIIHVNRYWGDLLNKPVGNIYSGGLFVTHLEGFNNSYNIRPEKLPLDRDRCVPRAFDVEYAAGMILQDSNKMKAKDLSYSDSRYIDRVPEHIVKNIKPRRVGNDIAFTMKDEDGKDQVINNSHLKPFLQSHNIFQKAIMGIKKFLAKQLGVYDMLVEFKGKHYLSPEALQDFELILEKVNK